MEDDQKEQQRRTLLIIIVSIIGVLAFLYVVGIVTQVYTNYLDWLDHDGFSGQYRIKSVNWNPLYCIGCVASAAGLKTLGLFLIIGGIIFCIFKLYNRFGGKKKDPRGFTKNDSGVYGTATMMEEKEAKKLLEVSTIENTKGVILGEMQGKIVSMPKDTRLNKHIAIFGASGTMKSRAIIRNALFQALKNQESVVVTDPKGELYGDMAELYRANGYTVKVLNLVKPEHSDSWNCMSDLNGDPMLAQLLTTVIIGNTSQGKGDHFWDNGESNLLRGLILLVDHYKTNAGTEKHLGTVYRQLARFGSEEVMKDIASLPENSPAIESFNLFAQASETVRTGIITGLGARLQILQTPAVRRMISTSDIDLTLPGREKCAYFIVLSESNKSMAFLSSLFFSCLFIKLMDYADSNANGKCAVPVNMILDEFNNIGKLGGAEDGSDFAAILSTCRSRELRVMMAIQSLGQLKNRYPNELWSEIVGNCDIQLMLGCTDKLTADYFSERSGDMTVDVNNVMTNRRTLAVAQIIPEYRQMDGVGRRKVMLPDEILRLPQNELLCVVRGCNVLRLEKVDYTRHPFADKIIKTSVRDYKPKLPEIPVEIPIEKPKEEEPSIGVKRAKPVRIDGTKI